MAVLLAGFKLGLNDTSAGTPTMIPTLVFKDVSVYYKTRGTNGGTPTQIPTLVLKTITAQEGPGGGGGTVGSAI